jgi:hypothetical protein
MAVHLVITAGKDLGRKISIPKVGSKVGRSTSDNDIVIIDDMLSRHHCRFYFENDLLHVEDLDSANGTLVNDGEIKSKALMPGNEVLLGDTILKVVSNRIDGTVTESAADEVSPSGKVKASSGKPVVDLGFNSSKSSSGEHTGTSIGKKPLGFILVIVVVMVLFVWRGKIAHLFNSGNSYSYVSGTVGSGSWLSSAEAAKGSTNGGSAINDTYLISITSKLETVFKSVRMPSISTWWSSARCIRILSFML